MTDKDEISELKKELAEIKASLAPKPYDPAAAARWMDEMHQLAERRMSVASPFSHADFEAFEAACPTNTVRAIAMRDNRAPMTPSSAIPGGQQTGRVSTAPGIPGSGWRNAAPLAPPPGINWVDAQCIADDIKQRSEKK